MTLEGTQPMTTEPSRCECVTPAPQRIWGSPHGLECRRCRRIIPATIQLRLAVT